MAGHGRTKMVVAVAAASLAVPAVALGGSTYPPPTTDTNPPETVITKGPHGVVKRSVVKVHFTSDEVGSSFKCKLDKKKYKACTSPYVSPRLHRGKHTFSVRATDPAGNVDRSAAKLKFRVAG
jgi:hypothetical protein